MSPLDKTILSAKLSAIEIDMRELQFIIHLSEHEFASSFEAQLKTERLLERMIGRLTDINFHILKEKYSITPATYFDSFTMMGDQGEVDPTLAKEVAPFAGLQNILAHEYDAIDVLLLYQGAVQALSVIPRYLLAIVSLGKEGA